jgi:putative ABC transport system permease protein
MLKNYLKIAFRNLLNNKLFSLLNLIGLTVGLAVSSFIAIYVWHEFHYDQFQPLSERTYRINSLSKYGGQETYFPHFHETYAQEIMKQIPEVESVMRYSSVVRKGVVLESGKNHRFKEDRIGFSDDKSLSVMGCKALSGDKVKALADPGNIVLTRTLAEKYFGELDVVGKTIMYDKKYPLTVSAVLDDLPTNSVFQFDALISLASMPTLGDYEKHSFQYSGFLQTFLVLKEGTSIAAVEKKLEKVKLSVRFVSEKDKHFLEPLYSLHVGSKSESGDQAKQLYIFLTIAFLILVLAVINYVSLTTARATKRAREVGIRKAIGSRRNELVVQFFAESLLSTTISFMLAIVVLQALFSWGNQAFDLQLGSQVLQGTTYWFLMIGLWLSCSLLAGVYPALVLSAFQPQDVLKGSFSSGRFGAVVRQVFTTFQLTAAVGLIICCVVLYSQMHYLHAKNIGIARSQVVAMKMDSDIGENLGLIRDKIRQWAGPENVSVTQTALFTDRISTYFLTADKNKKELMVKFMMVDRNFMDMMDVKWISKPDTWNKQGSSKELTVYNQTLLKDAGIDKYDPVLKPEPFDGIPNDGIFTDFDVQSLHGATPPMMITIVSDTSKSLHEKGAYILVRLNKHTNVVKSLETLREIYESAITDSPFDYYFLDDAYNKLYLKEQRMAKLFNAFAGMTVLVACLGLLGFITFSVENREKEIGVRKVLGASVNSVVLLLSQNFIKLVLLSVVIASPISYYFMNKWLQNFAHKIQIEWWMFALSGLCIVTIALITISFQSIKAALMNPVKSLRSE